MEERDDFKKVFGAHKTVDLPIDLEDKIMANIHAQEKLSMKKGLGFSKNLGIFILSLTFFSILSLVVYTTGYSSPMLSEIGQVLLMSTAVFFLLWLLELSEGFITQKAASSKIVGS